MNVVSGESDEHEPPLFCSLGMFIIDTIEKDDGTVLHDVIGGAGTYAAVGSRIFGGPDNTGFVVDYGYDSTSEIEDEINAFQFNLITRRDKNRKCTRGLNTYRGDTRGFEYLTPKLRIVPDDLPHMLLRSRSFHLICTPERCIEVVDRLKNLRQAQGILEPLFTIWEPVPDSCVPAARSAFNKAMNLVSILSPNALEAAGILGRSLDNLAIAEVESMADDLLCSGAPLVVIRCSSQGSYVKSRSISKWFPAAIQDPSSVIDATGAGNTFCGALATVCASGGSLEHAMICASVAAGLAIEQIGLPRLIRQNDGTTWNGFSVVDLIETYSKRIDILS